MIAPRPMDQPDAAPTSTDPLALPIGRADLLCSTIDPRDGSAAGPSSAGARVPRADSRLQEDDAVVARARRWGMPPRSATLIMILLIAASFYPSLDNQFAHIDDQINFEDNREFLGMGWKQLAWAWKTTLLGVYQPVAWICLSAESSLWGTDPRAYHAVNLLFHAFNAVLLARLAGRLIDRSLGRLTDVIGRASGVSSAAVAAATTLYAVHPLRTETVAWASCQPYLLSAFFGLLSIHAYLAAQDPGSPRRQVVSWLASYLLFWMALMCKAPAIALPVLLLVLDVYPLRRLDQDGSQTVALRRILVDKLPYLTLAVPFVYFTRNIRAHSPAELVPGFQGPFARLAHACYSACFYPAKTIWPFDLICHYEIPRGAHPTAPIFLFCTLVVAILSLALIAARRRWPGLLATWAAYLVLLAPSSGLSPFGGNITADRYSYLSMMAWVPALAVVIDRLLRVRRATSLAAALALAGILSGFIVLSQRQSRTWHDLFTLWQHALEHGGRKSFTIQNNFGMVLALRGKPEEALAHFDESMAIFATLDTLRNRLRALAEMNRFDQGVADLERQIRLQPDQALWRFELGSFLMRSNDRLDQAVAQLRAVVRLEPANVRAHLLLGDALSKKGAWEEAAVPFAEAVRLAPGVPDLHDRLGTALSRLGRDADAASHFDQAKRRAAGAFDHNRSSKMPIARDAIQAAPSGLLRDTQAGRRGAGVFGPSGHTKQGGMPVGDQELRIGRSAQDRSRTLSRSNDVPPARDLPKSSGRTARISAGGTIPIETP
jgi:Tfp pilus assembly protein PilF